MSNLYSISDGWAELCFDIAGVLLIILDSEGKVLNINQKGCEILGRKKEEIIGKNWFDNFLPSSTRASTKSVFEKIITGEMKSTKSEYFENPVIGADDNEHFILWRNAVLRNTKGEIIGTLSSGEDITKFRQIEDELVKIQKIQFFEQFAGRIAHNINNILTVIQGNLYLAKMLDSKQKKIIQEMLEQAEEATIKAKNIVNELALFSSDAEYPEKTLVDINEFLRKTVNIALKGTKLKPIFKLADNIPNVEADEQQISQALHNIIMNAVEAMPEGGEIEITALNMVLDVDRPKFELSKGKYVEISIKDNGLGIPEENIKRIFDPYFTTKSDKKGLGLTIACSLIRRNKGYLTAVSELGEGSAFYIYFPASEKKMSKTKSEAKKQDTFTPADVDALLKNKTVMVADDDEMILKTLSMMLKSLGCKVQTANSAQKAVEAYLDAKNSGQKIDIVIMDYLFPDERSGIEATRKIMELDPDAKIIVTSGYYGYKVSLNFEGFNIVDILLKPFTINELKESLIKALS